MYVMGCDFCQESWQGLDAGAERKCLVTKVSEGKWQ